MAMPSIMTPLTNKITPTFLIYSGKSQTSKISLNRTDSPTTSMHNTANGYYGNGNCVNGSNGHENGHQSHSPPVPELPVSLSFKVFLVNAKTNGHSEEWRQLRFFFHSTTKKNRAVIHEEDKMTIAQSFFRDLVNPTDFPANYVGYIMKIMKLMQMKHHSISKMEVEMKLVRELAELPSRPSEYFYIISTPLSSPYPLHHISQFIVFAFRALNMEVPLTYSGLFFFGCLLSRILFLDPPFALRVSLNLLLNTPSDNCLQNLPLCESFMTCKSLATKTSTPKPCLTHSFPKTKTLHFNSTVSNFTNKMFN